MLQLRKRAGKGEEEAGISINLDNVVPGPEKNG